MKAISVKLMFRPIFYYRFASTPQYTIDRVTVWTRSERPAGPATGGKTVDGRDLDPFHTHIFAAPGKYAITQANEGRRR